MADRIRVGAVAYLNSKPLVHGLERGLGAERLELSYAVPSELAARMARGALEIALLPTIELARIPDLEVVPGLGITTRGAARSVFLVCRRPVGEIESLALDPESRTSNALAQVLLAQVWRRRPETTDGGVDLDASLRAADAAVRIGDKALFERPPDGVEIHDLGTVWTEANSLPFVFAVWAARAGVVDREIYRLLHDSRREGVAAAEQIATDYEWQGRTHAELALDYLTRHIRFRLGGDEVRAITLFHERAAALGLIERAPKLRMALERRTQCHEGART